MDIDSFIEFIGKVEINFITGVPDSLMAPFLVELRRYSESSESIRFLPAANEGLAVSMALGSYLANGKPGVVYMQNSGFGNTINPLLSLAHKLVFRFPIILLIGWRGEPGLNDEPQHEVQGRLTLELLKIMEIEYKVVRSSIDLKDGVRQISKLLELQELGVFAFVFSKSAFQ